MNIFIRLLLLTVLLVSVMSLNGQDSKPAAPDRDDKLSGLDFMVGEWVGEGWIQIGRERKTFTARESLERKLDGSLLVVDGLGRSVDEKTGVEKVVHQAYGIFYYDYDSRKVLFRFFKADGPAGLSEPVFSKNKVVWGFVAEPTKSEVRFTELLDEEGNWVEKGEVMLKGRNEWIQFFFMKLKRVE